MLNLRLSKVSEAVLDREIGGCDRKQGEEKRERKGSLHFEMNEWVDKSAITIKPTKGSDKE
jgi:hypothetical protein